VTFDPDFKITVLLKATCCSNMLCRHLLLKPQNNWLHIVILVKTVRRVDSVLEVILLRSDLLFSPGFALTMQDYDCMLETVVRVS